MIKQTQVYDLLLKQSGHYSKEQKTVSELQLSVPDAWCNTLSIDFVVVLGYGTCSEKGKLPVGKLQKTSDEVKCGNLSKMCECKLGMILASVDVLCLCMLW